MTKHRMTSPGLLYFGQDLESCQFYRGAETMVLWDQGKHGIRNVTVAFMPARRVPVMHPLWQEWRRYGRLWDYAFGSISRHWMSGVVTPDSLFDHFLEVGFAPGDELDRAYREFARIEECGWARDHMRARTATPSHRERVASIIRHHDEAVRRFRAHRRRTVAPPARPLPAGRPPRETAGHA